MPGSAYYIRQAQTLARYASVCEDTEQADLLRGMARRMLQKAQETVGPEPDRVSLSSGYGCLWMGSTQ